MNEIINDPIYLERLGTLSIHFTYENVERILSLQEDSIQGTFLVTDEDMNVYFSYGDLADGILEEIVFGTVQKEVKLDDLYYIQTSVEPVSNLMIMSIIPRKELASLFTYKITI